MTDTQADASLEELDFSIPEEETEEVESQEEEIQEEEQGTGLAAGNEEIDQESQQKQEESSVIREMRKQLREKERKLRELEAKGAAPVEVEAKDPGEMPDIEAFDYDSERYKAAVQKWHADKLKYERQVSEQQGKQQEVVKAYESALSEYKTNGAKIKGFDDAEKEVASVLSVEQQNMLLLKAPKEAHRIVLALSRAPDQLERLAKIKDPVDFGIELGDLKRRAQSAPRAPAKSVKAEREIKGSSGTSATTLDRLKKSAQETGDYSAYYDAKRRAAASKK